MQNRITINPARNYFKTAGSDLLVTINEAIEELESSVETREIGVQAVPKRAFNPEQLNEAYDGNCIMAVSKMEDFIDLSNDHTLRCGTKPVLVKRCNTSGAAMKWTYMCPGCCEEIIVLNCDYVNPKSHHEGLPTLKNNRL